MLVWYFCHNKQTNIDTLLFTEVHTLFRFLNFYQGSFSVLESSPWHHITSSPHVSLDSPGLSEFLRLSLFWWHSQFLGILVRFSVEGLSVKTFSTVALIIRLDWYVSGMKTAKVKFHFHHIMPQYVLSTWLTTSHVDLHHLVEAMFVRFLQCRITLVLASHRVFFRGMSLSSVYNEEVKSYALSA